MAAKTSGLLLTIVALALAAAGGIPSAEAGCTADVKAHAPGYIPNCNDRDPLGIHRSGERYCARKTETGPDGEVFCPPNNHWISKAEAYRLAGYGGK